MKGVDALKCSFCNKPSPEVAKLIAGPRIYICNECVELCNQILRQESLATHWFTAVLVVESRLPDSREKVLVDLQFRLIAAPDAEAAYHAALKLGHDEKLDYPNASGETVSWTFVGLRDLVEVGAAGLLEHGTELYSDLVHAEPDKLVVPKERLSVFWTQANKNKTARELLEDE